MIKEIIGYTTATTVLPKVDSGPSHEYVDLGLPSGTLWATMNVGANSSTDVGNLYDFSEMSQAISEWGNGWTIPTKEQWEELNAYKNAYDGYFSFKTEVGELIFPSTRDQYEPYIGPVYYGEYWTSTEKDQNNGYLELQTYYMTNSSSSAVVSYRAKSDKYAVRLVKQ